jgi:hypothetical protein
MRSLPPGEHKAPEAELSRMLGELHRALEVYHSERGQYPQQISAVMNERYELGELKNPWSGQPLRELAAGGEAEAGCFSYIPHVSEGSGGLKVTEYFLVGYGEGLAPTAPELPDYAVLEEDAARRIVVSYRGGAMSGSGQPATSKD